MTYSHGLVGSDGGLDLRESLGVVGLGHAGVGGSEGLGLDKGPLLAVGGGDGLVAGLASDNSVAVVAEAVANKHLRGSGGSSEDCSKANKGLEQRTVKSQRKKESCSSCFTFILLSSGFLDRLMMARSLTGLIYPEQRDVRGWRLSVPGHWPPAGGAPTSLVLWRQARYYTCPLLCTVGLGGHELGAV